MGSKNGTDLIDWDLGRSIMLTWILRMYDMKAALRCHAHVSGPVHRGTAAISTTPGLIVPVLRWDLGRKVVICHSRPVLPRRCLLSLRIQWRGTRCALCYAAPTNRYDYTPMVCEIKLFSVIVNELKDDMKWMNENMKWHEERDHRCGQGVTSLPLTFPGFDPGRVSFPCWGFRGFSSTVRQMSGKLRPHPSPDIIGYHNHQKSLFTDTIDLDMLTRPKTQI